jgi:thiamine biosynthesis lipoprotein
VRRILATAALALLATAIVWLTLRREAARIQQTSRFLMDSYCTIQATGRGSDLAAKKAMDRMAEVAWRLNAHDPRSEVHAFNTSGASIVDPDVVACIEAAVQLSAKSDGAFDVTVFPLVALWGFHEGPPRLPGEGEIQTALRRIGWRDLVVEHGRIAKRRSDVAVDLGGIGQGYAVRAAVEVLRREGVEAALVDVSGDIFALGHPRGRLWRIGIKDPRGEGVLGVVRVADLAVVTSGDYERFFEKDGVRYHHILDPKTGWPARSLASVTIMDADPVTADALATAVLVLGPEKGLALVESLPGAEALLVDEGGRQILSSGFAALTSFEPREKVTDSSTP